MDLAGRMSSKVLLEAVLASYVVTVRWTYQGSEI